MHFEREELAAVILGTMGAVWSYLWPGMTSAEFITDSSLDEVDPSTGLTGRQKKVIRETWAMIKEDFGQNATDFFVLLFTKHPDYQKKFNGLETLTVEQLKKSKRLRAHGSNVLYAFTSMVDNLDDVECLKELLLKIGRNHIKRKLTSKHFDNVAIAVVEFLELKIGPKFTPFAATAWESALKVINSIIVEGLNGKDEEY